MDITANTGNNGLNRRAVELTANCCIPAGLSIDLVELQTERPRALDANSRRGVLRRMNELIGQRTGNQ